GDDYRQLNKGNARLDFILEPFGRNTAAAVAAAALHVS
ncbi:mannose-1-phosphate guanylyltransferase/mannose-6-phosphate isomerase, partial [Pseudomonas syringae pv. pisi str. 1704B]